MTKRVGIVSYSHGSNYGCDLQGYAMERTVGMLGYEYWSIKYVPPGVPESFSVWINVPKTIRRIRDSLRYRYYRFPRFQSFRQTYRKYTPRLASYDEVEKIGSDFDAFVAGSDQIWNPQWMPTETFYKYYMLDFAPPERRISYAASMGISEIDERYIPLFQKYLSEFPHISVREEEGGAALKKIIPRPVEVVLDPTLLLRQADWDILADSAAACAAKEPFILCYSLGNMEPCIEKSLEIQKFLGGSILVLCTNLAEVKRIRRGYRNQKIVPVTNAGPCEFVDLMRKSHFVVTDSFHGTIFSVIYCKPFMTMMRDMLNPSASMNSRISTLFDTLKLHSRLFSPESPKGAPSELTLDYAPVEPLIEARRADSIHFLKNALFQVAGEP